MAAVRDELVEVIGGGGDVVLSGLVAGVLIELARKLRRIVFVAIGVILLALSSRRKGATSSSTT